MRTALMALGFSLIALFLFFGCTTPATCGNKVCEQSSAYYEDINSCPQDCKQIFNTNSTDSNSNLIDTNTNQDQNKLQILVIGEPSLGEKVTLDYLSETVDYRIRDASSFDYNASEELIQYDIVILDQSNIVDKSVIISLAQAIKGYVNKNGKLIIIKNSGIRQNLGNNMTATDVISWKANFGNIIPADCVLGSDNVPACAPESAINISGRIYTLDFNNPIMKGIDVTPPIEEIPYSLETFPIQANTGATTVAYIKSENTPQSFPAILEKKAPILNGTVIYFNYDPGTTPVILSNTLNYLAK